MLQKTAPEIVLTGGPCSGKTTGLGVVSEKLQDFGYRAFLVREIATMFITGGIPDLNRIAELDLPRYLDIEEQMILTQLALRKKFNDVARIFKDEKCVIISDRGGMDAKPYIPERYFEAILEENNLSLYDVCGSYDAVIHLVTAAIGAEEFYTVENNKARQEKDLEQARVLDGKTLQAWVGHENLKIIDNEGSKDFDHKMRRLVQTICQILEIPVPLEVERKFLLKEMPSLDLEALSAQDVEIEQVYLQSLDDEEIRIRKRSQGGSATYYKTYKKKISPGIRSKVKRFITPREYIELKALQDPDSQVVRKRRTCFVYQNQYFELDEFSNPPGPVILEIELTQENDKVQIPPFIKVEREVTEDPNFSNYEISRR